MPVPNDMNGFEFIGWYTGENGSGSQVNSDTRVNNANNHSLYAYFTKILLDINVSGIVNNLFHLPNSDSEKITVSVTITCNQVDVTNEHRISLLSSDSNVLVVEGMNVKKAD